LINLGEDDILDDKRKENEMMNGEVISEDVQNVADVDVVKEDEMDTNEETPEDDRVVNNVIENFLGKDIEVANYDQKKPTEPVEEKKPDVINILEKETPPIDAPIQVMRIPIGPKIFLKRSNFEMLSMMFSTFPTPSKSVMEEICDDTEMTPKDIKWIFVKLRHKFDHRKGVEINQEGVNEMINTVRSHYKKDDILEL